MSNDIESQVLAGQDGNVRKLTAAGYVVIAQHGGSEGWKDIDGKRCFVDYYGGVWAKSDNQIESSEAYNTGFEAAAQGESRSANPYAKGTWDSSAWFAGWDAQ